MKRKCPKCGSIEESKFCTNCGQDLSDAAIVKTCPKQNKTYVNKYKKYFTKANAGKKVTVK